MIMVVYILRTPGNHREVHRAESSFVPRKNENVCLPGEDCARFVHDVCFVVSENVVHVLLQDN